MPKHITIAIPHHLSAAEVRRRLNQETDWALGRLKQGKIHVTLADWSHNDRAFLARAFGQVVSGSLIVADNSLWLEATVPWIFIVFIPAIEAAARRYAAHLLMREAV